MEHSIISTKGNKYIGKDLKGGSSDLTVPSRRLPLGPKENHEDNLLLSYMHLTVWFFLSRLYNFPRYVTVAILRSHLS